MAEENETIEEETNETAKAPEKVEVDNSADKAEIAKLKKQLADAKEAEKAVKGNSKKLLDEKKEADAKLKALGDYEKVKQILEAVNSVEEAEQIQAGDVEVVYQKRHQKFLDDVHNPVLEELEKVKCQLASVRAEYQDKAKTDPLNEAWIKAHGKPDKLKYVLGQAKDVFKFNDNGELLPYDADGNIIYGKGGTEPMTPEQYFAGFLLNEPDFKIPSKGTDAKGGGDGKLTITGNPWSADYKGSDKATKKFDIMRTAPQEAKRLKREAGIPV